MWGGSAQVSDSVFGSRRREGKKKKKREMVDEVMCGLRVFQPQVVSDAGCNVCNVSMMYVRNPFSRGKSSVFIEDSG